MILTVALIAPNAALEREKQSVYTPSPPPLSHYALEAPRSPILTFQEYAGLSAEETGIDEAKFKELIECESRWKEDAAGDNGTSLGILQFKEATFALFSKKYGAADADIADSQQQIDLAALMIRDGYLWHWKNCARKIDWVS